MQGWGIIFAAIAYLLFLFVVASYGDRRLTSDPRHRRDSRSRSAIYAPFTGNLLHVLDVFRIRGTGIEVRTRFSGDLSWPDPDDHPWLSPVQPYRCGGQKRAHHIDRGLHRLTLWKERLGGCLCGCDRHAWHRPLYRPAAESDFDYR